MIRWQRIGLVECPNCGWKSESTQKVCPMCDSKLPVAKLKSNAIVEQKSNEVNVPKFDIDDLIISTPDKYISDFEKNKLIDNGDFLKLVANSDNLPYSHKVIFYNIDEIIEKANSKFIQYEKTIKIEEFRKDLYNHEGIITDDEKKRFKEKYHEDYYDYYFHLKFARHINEYNNEIINKEKDIILNEFEKELGACNHVISDMDRAKFKTKYNKEPYKFYDKLDFDGKIDDFNKNLIKKERELESKKLIVQFENEEFSIDAIISKIDCSLFDGESFKNDRLNEEFEEFINSPIFEIISDDLDEEESSKLTIKIREDISNEKISGDVADILDFYFDQYKSIKKQYSLNNFLNDYVGSDDFNKLLVMYDRYADDVILGIVNHVKKDIIEDDSMDYDKVILKLEYYFKAETYKIDYLNQIDEIKRNSRYYMDKYKLLEEEFDEILNYIQINVSEGYHIKNLHDCFIRKIKEKIDENRDKSRLKLKKLLNDQEFIEKNNITPENLNHVSEYVGGLIYENKVRSDQINEHYLLLRLR